MRALAVLHDVVGPSLRSSAALLSLAVVLGLALPACAGQRTFTTHSVQPAVADATPQPAGPGLHLPPPMQLRDTAASTGQAKPGREYEALLPHNLVAAAGDQAQFTPDWDQGGGITGAAYAMYQFGLAGYSGQESLALTWAQPGGFAYAWLGVANFARNRWDWFHLPAAVGNISRLHFDFAEYIQPGDGRMLVVPLFIDPTPALWLLSEVRVGVIPGQPWLHTWGGAELDAANGAATDAAGNLYLTGSSASFGTGETELVLLKYAPDGELLWQKVWSGGGRSEGIALCVDNSGDIYVTGGAYEQFNEFGLLLLRLDSSGALAWRKIYTTAAWTAPMGVSIGVDNAGNVFVGTVVLTPEDTPNGLIDQMDAIAIKLSPQGDLLWDSVWAGPHSDHIAFIVPDQAGGCYDGGWLNGFDDYVPQAVALRFNADGTLAWARSWSNGYLAKGLRVALAPDGALWLAGHAQANAASAEQALLLALSPAGNLLSASTLGGAYGAKFYNLAVAADGAVHACGVINMVSATPTSRDAFYGVVGAGGLERASAWGNPDISESFDCCAFGSGGAFFLAGSGLTPDAGSWSTPAVGYEAQAAGTLANEATALKELASSLSDITGELRDVAGVQDTATGDDANLLACQP